LWWLGAKGDASASWPSAVGTVQESRLEQRQVNAGGDRDNTWEYFPQLRYQYQVQGKTYQSGSRRFPNPGYSRSQQEVADILSRYRQAHRCGCITTRPIRPKPVWKPVSTGLPGLARRLPC
jgi:hypothetical protein